MILDAENNKYQRNEVMYAHLKIGNFLWEGFTLVEVWNNALQGTLGQTNHLQTNRDDV